jgi:hypothetical protein
MQILPLSVGLELAPFMGIIEHVYENDVEYSG